MGSATFFDAFDALSLAFVLPVLVRLWGISSGADRLAHRGRLSRAVRRRADLRRRSPSAIGRVRSAAGATALMSVMSLALRAWPAASRRCWRCRLVQGIGVGGEMPVAAVYINELSKAQGRGRFFLLYEMIFPIGLMVTGQIGALLVPTFGWQVMFLIGGIPGLRHHGAAAAAARVAALADRARAARRGRGHHRRDRSDAPDRAAASVAGPTSIEAATGCRHQPQPRTAHGGWTELLSPRLPPPHARRLDALGERVLHHQRPEQLDADALQPRLRPRPAAVAARRHADQRRAGHRAARLRVRDRSDRPPALDGRLLRRRRAAARRCSGSSPRTR